MKNKKASSFDSILNEMIKAGAKILSKPLEKLFNSILENQTYPTEWKHDILGPIHKTGPLDDVNNFRGICITSCLGKLFNSVLKNRLELYLNKNGAIHKSQLSRNKMLGHQMIFLLNSFLFLNM